jgi:chromosomal replication initiator protein
LHNSLQQQKSIVKHSLRQHLLQTSTDAELKRWFDPLHLVYEEESKRVVVGFPHPFFAKWFESAVQDRFEAQLNMFLGNGYLVSYRDNGSADRQTGVRPAEVVKRIDFPFGQEFTFDTFLINKKNYFPIASAREVAKQSASLFNPFIICGPGGSGKTHLIRSVANEISKKHDYSTIFMGSGAIRSGRAPISSSTTSCSSTISRRSGSIRISSRRWSTSSTTSTTTRSRW